MKRRELAALGGAAALWSGRAEGQQAMADLLELRAYTLTEAQREPFVKFLGEVAAPALTRLGLGPVGLFGPREGAGAVWLLLRHPHWESVATVEPRLLADEQYVREGGAIVAATAPERAYEAVETRLMVAFAGMPHLERPVTGDGRVFQLRIYESPSEQTGLKKIEMFDTKEIAIFRKVGLTPVFFGRTVIGPALPNLTYMLGFESAEEQAAAWKRFLADPEWLDLRSRPEYADKRIIRKITNLNLMPLPGSLL